MKNKLSLFILAIALPFASRAQNTNFAGAPPQYQTMLGIIDSIPTVPLDEANVYIDTGAWNGPSVNTSSGEVSTVLENFIDVDILVSSNVLVGGELRNVINHVDYTGLDLGYNIHLTTNMVLTPTIHAGWDLDSRAPQAAFEAGIRYHPMGGAPYLFASAGYAETFGIRTGYSKSGGGGVARAGVTLPFKR